MQADLGTVQSATKISGALCVCARMNLGTAIGRIKAFWDWRSRSGKEREIRSELSVSGCVSASPGNVSETEASAESAVSSFSLARKTKRYAAFGTLLPAFVCHSCKLLWARTVSYVCLQHLAQWGHGLGWGLRFCCNTNTNQLWNFMKDYFLPGLYLWRMQLY